VAIGPGKWGRKPKIMLSKSGPENVRYREIVLRPHFPPVQPAGKTTAGGQERLCRPALAMVQYFRDTMPMLVPLVSHPGFQFEDFARQHPGSPLDVLRRDLVAFFAEEGRAGRTAAVDPGAAALMVFSLAQCVAFFGQMGAHGGRFPASLVERAVQCLWNGLAPRTRRKR